MTLQNVLKQRFDRSLENLHVRLKGLRRVGEEEDVKEGESINPHCGGGGLVCQGEDDAWKKGERTGKESR